MDGRPKGVIVVTFPLMRAFTSLLKASSARIRLQGEPAIPIDPDPHVCRFYGRCPKGATRCTTAMPLLAVVGEGHWAACHYPEMDKMESP